MGCGTSKAVPAVVDQDAPDNLKETHLISDAQEELTYVDSPDKVSEPVGPQVSSPSPPAVRTNGIDPSLPQTNGDGVHHQVGEEEEVRKEEKEEDVEEVEAEEVEERKEEKGKLEDFADLAETAGGRAVAFEVGSPEEEAESLIKRHPPRKFQRLEDQQQQGANLTQEILEEKQVEAEKRRQEILSQRVQSAKQRTAKSAGRMRTRPDDADDVEQLEGGIESADSITTENEL